jgi:hypothetical protein
VESLRAAGISTLRTRWRMHSPAIMCVWRRHSPGAVICLQSVPAC